MTTIATAHMTPQPEIVLNATMLELVLVDRVLETKDKDGESKKRKLSHSGVKVHFQDLRKDPPMTQDFIS
ncbi:predicted protein [Sclerotinia sclerotiorum 1980 UF-70]|uniref:Uncharacterized protein n=1 Tax=Sclerotinia sclerotiorum (strain ATCC 18683 / 1980 / Ss-1) TaxID=665079 RepID=A7E7C7_SCLS1|nr:predicted protein [Sclerotinia sclerotiorum 1980 UF-70]EDN96279.1 predicted protein [Sclerotinia sclerotiorum 1980 UF-70]